MLENKNSLSIIIALIIGIAGVGLSAFSIINFQILEGPSGQDGQDGLDGKNGIDGLDGVNGINGTDGQDAPRGILVGILEPDNGESIWGNVTIRAVVYGSETYSISILLNDTIELGTRLPLIWNSSAIDEGWWNLSIVVTDLESSNSSRDYVVVNVNNHTYSGIKRTWYAYDALFSSVPQATDTINNDLCIWFDINPGEWFLFSFASIAKLNFVDWGYMYLKVYFAIDDQKISHPYTQVIISTELTNQIFTTSISLLYSNNAISLGTHNATIYMWWDHNRGSGSSELIDQSFIVQTYIP